MCVSSNRHEQIYLTQGARQVYPARPKQREETSASTGGCYWETSPSGDRTMTSNMLRTTWEVYHHNVLLLSWWWTGLQPAVAALPFGPAIGLPTSCLFCSPIRPVFREHRRFSCPTNCSRCRIYKKRSVPAIPNKHVSLVVFELCLVKSLVTLDKANVGVITTTLFERITKPALAHVIGSALYFTI